MSTPRSAESGQFVWHELLTPDPERALRFYRELAGWKVRPVDRGRAGTCRVVSTAGIDQGGVLTLLRRDIRRSRDRG